MAGQKAAVARPALTGPVRVHLKQNQVTAKYTVPQQISVKEQSEYRFAMRNPYWGRGHVTPDGCHFR